MIVLLSISCLSACQPVDVPTITPYAFVTATLRPTATPVTPTVTPTLPPATPREATIPPTMPPTYGPTPTPMPEVTATIPGISGEPCSAGAQGIFRPIYEGDPGLPSALGCPTAPTKGTYPQIWPVDIIYQPCERGHLVWLSNLGWFAGRVIYVLLDDLTYTRYDDTFDPNLDPAGGNASVPAGLYEPLGALGKVWRETPGLRERIGFGTAPASQARSEMMMFQYGEMLSIPQNGIVFVFKRGTPNTWSVYSIGQ